MNRNMIKFKNYYWFVWSFAIVYSLYKFKTSAEKHFFSLHLSDFENGWTIINRPKDVTDMEWSVLSLLFKKYWPMLLFQIILSRLCFRFARKVFFYFYTIYSIICLTAILGFKATLFLISYILVMVLVHLLGNISFCYFITISALILKNSYISDIMIVENENEAFIFDIAFTWIIAKSLSFMVDRIDYDCHKETNLKDFGMIMTYSLYLPTFFTGPIMMYNAFILKVMAQKRGISLKVVLQKIKHFCYVLVCYAVYEIMLHFLYSSSIQYYPDVAQQFDSWSWCGLGYALSLMFFFKYFIIYSVAGSIASFEYVELPPPPKCISCIHLSSYLWRHFDRGLYLWILRYIYHPLLGKPYNIFKKVYALGFSFLFVSLWHKIDKAVCTWTFLNFLLVLSEIAAVSFFSSRKVKKYLPSFLYQKHYQAALATPAFILMCISSTFFLSNWEIGVLLFKRLLLTGVIPFLPLCLIMFCGCKVSLDVRQWEGSFYRPTPLL